MNETPRKNEELLRAVKRVNEADQRFVSLDKDVLASMLDTYIESLQAWADECLQRIMVKTGWTKEEVMETLLMKGDKAIPLRMGEGTEGLEYWFEELARVRTLRRGIMMEFEFAANRLKQYQSYLAAIEQWVIQ